MMIKPLLSVCIPTMNRHHVLEQTLTNLLMQNKTSTIQFVVSDNCSTDGTKDFLSKLASQHPGLLHIRQSDRISFDQNVLASVKKATGKHIWVLPDDDEIKDGALEIILERLLGLDRNVGVFVNFGHSNKIDSSLDIEWVVDLGKDCSIVLTDLDRNLIRSLSYLRSYISLAQDWESAADFIGSGFIHTGVALNSIARRGGVAIIADPQVKVSVGMHTWESGELEVKIGGWSLMAEKLDSIKYNKFEKERIKDFFINTVISIGSLVGHRINGTLDWRIFVRHLHHNLSVARNAKVGIIAITPIFVFTRLRKVKHLLQRRMT